MWVGNSLLFNWLDRNLRPTPGESTAGAATKGPLGQIWLLHSGAFYYVEKTLLGGDPLPKPLHWFKWQAYTTWLSGLLLLIVVYWFGGRADLVDPSILHVHQPTGLLIAWGAVFGGWALYESMNRFVAPRAPKIAAAVWIVGLAAISIALTQVLSGRAAFLHVGAMLGTIMAANVFLTIVPSQRELVKSVKQGGIENVKALSLRAKHVSIHNNYFTFPVIALMVSNHFPSFYGNRYSWLVLLILIGAGALVRHLLNLRYSFSAWKPAVYGTLIAGMAALYVIAQAGSATSTVHVMPGAPVTFSDVRHVIDQRCVACHSAHPSDMTFGGVPPMGVIFDTPEQIEMRAQRIYQRAVLIKTMPFANKTNMTDEERSIIARWIGQGASR